MSGVYKDGSAEPMKNNPKPDFRDDRDENFPVEEYNILESIEIDDVLNAGIKADPLKPRFDILRRNTDVLFKTGTQEVYDPEALPTVDDMVGEADLSGIIYQSYNHE